jgi:hypothetical protein
MKNQRDTTSEDIAFKYAKDALLEEMQGKEQKAEKTFEVFNVSEELWDKWFKEVTSNQSLFTSISKTFVIQQLLNSSTSLTEYSAKMMIFYQFKQKIMEMSSNPLMGLINLLK